MTELETLRARVAELEADLAEWKTAARKVEFTLGCANGKIEVLQAIVDKLPKCADTGQPFIPGYGLVWIVNRFNQSIQLAGRIAYSPIRDRWEDCEWGETEFYLSRPSTDVKGRL